MTKAAVKLRALGLSQSALAEKLDITQGAVSRLLNGERVAGGGPRTAAFKEFGIPPTDWDEPFEVAEPEEPEEPEEPAACSPTPTAAE